MPQLSSVKTCALGPQRPFSPTVPEEAGCLFAVASQGQPVSSYFSMACYFIVSH